MSDNVQPKKELGAPMSHFTRNPRTHTPPGGWVTRTYRLSRYTVAAIDDLAQKLGVNQSDLVSFLLEKALVPYTTGKENVPIVTREVHAVQHDY